AVHAVDAEDSNSPLLEVRAEGANHSLAFHLPFVATARRECEDGRAVISVNGNPHVSIKAFGVPTVMVTMHGCEDSWSAVGLKPSVRAGSRVIGGNSPPGRAGF